MRKLFLIFIVLANAVFGYSQKKNNTLSKKQGIILFEGDLDMYFIETLQTDLTLLLNTGMDTVTGYMLYTSDGPYNFRKYLTQNTNFDSVLFNIKQENHLGRQYEEVTKVYWKYGVIEFINRKGYKLKKRYKALHLNDKLLAIAMDDYLPIEVFIPADIKK